jgi:hypothetical protein
MVAQWPAARAKNYGIIRGIFVPVNAPARQPRDPKERRSRRLWDRNRPSVVPKQISPQGSVSRTPCLTAVSSTSYAESWRIRVWTENSPGEGAYPLAIADNLRDRYDTRRAIGGAVCEAGATEAAAGARVSVMMLGTPIINTRPCVRRVVPERTFDPRCHRVRLGIDSGATDKGQCNQNNQPSEQY